MALREAQLKENNSGGAQSFLKLVCQLQKLTWVPGVTEKMVSGDREARVTLSSIPRPSEMPWGPSHPFAIHHQAHVDKDSHEGGSPWQERERSNRDQVSPQTSLKGQAKGLT